MTTYQYDQGTPLTTRFVYAYSDTSAPDFMEAFAASRARARTDLQDMADRAQNVTLRPPPDNLDQRLQRFEVTGKVYSAYEDNGRGAAGALHDRIDDYVDFAEWVAAAYRDSGALPYLNGLIKVVDVICAERTRISTTQLARRVCRLLDDEREHIADLQQQTR